MEPVHVSIIIPAFNEEKNIRLGSLEKVLRFLLRQPYRWEVILVDDGSNDDTRKLLDQFALQNQGFRVIHNRHQGKATTVITGILAATGNVVLFSDLDQATPIHELEKLLPWFRKGYDVVIGSRYAKREGAPLLRLFMARGFMMLRSVILGIEGISDTQCGFKAFRKSVAHDIFGRLRLYGHGQAVSGSKVTAGFDIEVLYVAKKQGYKVKEVPVEWHYVETRRVNPLKDSWQGFADIIAIRLNAWKGMYT